MVFYILCETRTMLKFVLNIEQKIDGAIIATTPKSENSGGPWCKVGLKNWTCI